MSTVTVLWLAPRADVHVQTCTTSLRWPKTSLANNHIGGNEPISPLIGPRVAGKGETIVLPFAQKGTLQKGTIEPRSALIEQTPRYAKGQGPCCYVELRKTRSQVCSLKIHGMEFESTPAELKLKLINQSVVLFLALCGISAPVALQAVARSGCLQVVVEVAGLRNIADQNDSGVLISEIEEFLHTLPPEAQGGAIQVYSTDFGLLQFNGNGTTGSLQALGKTVSRPKVCWAWPCCVSQSNPSVHVKVHLPSDEEGEGRATTLWRLLAVGGGQVLSEVELDEGRTVYSLSFRPEEMRGVPVVAVVVVGGPYISNSAQLLVAPDGPVHELQRLYARSIREACESSIPTIDLAACMSEPVATAVLHAWKSGFCSLLQDLCFLLQLTPDASGSGISADHSEVLLGVLEFLHANRMFHTVAFLERALSSKGIRLADGNGTWGAIERWAAQLSEIELTSELISAEVDVDTESATGLLDRVFTEDTTLSGTFEFNLTSPAHSNFAPLTSEVEFSDLVQSSEVLALYPGSTQGSPPDDRPRLSSVGLMLRRNVQRVQEVLWGWGLFGFPDRAEERAFQAYSSRAHLTTDWVASLVILLTLAMNLALVLYPGPGAMQWPELMFTTLSLATPGLPLLIISLRRSRMWYVRHRTAVMVTMRMFYASLLALCLLGVLRPSRQWAMAKCRKDLAFFSWTLLARGIGQQVPFPMQLLVVLLEVSLMPLGETRCWGHADVFAKLRGAGWDLGLASAIRSTILVLALNIVIPLVKERRWRATFLAKYSHVAARAGRGQAGSWAEVEQQEGGCEDEAAPWKGASVAWVPTRAHRRHLHRD